MGQHAVQGVAKLMEQRRYLVPCNQRGLALGGFGIVADIVDHRFLVTQAALLGEGAHPRAAALGGATEIVGIEQCQGPAVLVHDLKDLHVGVVGGNVLALLETEPVDTVRSMEDAVLHHTVNVEIGLHLIVGQGEHFLLHLGREVETVVGLQLEVRAHRPACILLNGLGLGLGLGGIGLDQLLQEGIYVVGILGHGLFQRIGCVVVITHQLRLLGPQARNLYDKGEGVERPRAIGAVN